MNAIDPATPQPRGNDDGLPTPALADRAMRLLRGLTLATGAGVAAILLLWRWAAMPTGLPALAALRQTGLPRVLLASLLLALTGLAAAWLMAWARRRAVAPPPVLLRGRRWRWLPAGLRRDASLVGSAARWPQAILVTAGGLAAIAGAWLLPSGSAAPVPPPADFILGAAALALAFPLLIIERLFAGLPPARVPEAPALRGLLLLPVLAWPAAGLLRIAAGLGLPYADRADPVLLLPLTAVAVELCLRALGRCFLPPPAPAEARAAIDSLLARMIAEGVRTRSLAAPVRRHLGIDFSRSWALAYLRAATLPVVLLLALLSWGLSGIVLVGLDQRAVYQRFGAPVAVLHSGLHAILPWPMGQVRRLDYGTIREVALTGSDMALPVTRVGAEDPPPPDADRLWEQAHPAELTFLIASPAASRAAGEQSFQVVSADIRLRWRIGLSDRDALQAAYRVTDPAAVLQGVASRLAAGFFAGRTLDAVLGENREAMAERMRAAVQQQLDAIGCGIELAAVVIEAIHPPAGAAEAYHAVQAAEILAVSSIAVERGRALAARANASQYATELVAQSQAAAAEAVGTATADLTRFTADYAAAKAGGEAFLLERRLTALANGLAKSDLTIIDHRIPAAEAPMLDLRPPSPVTARSAGPGLE